MTGGFVHHGVEELAVVCLRGAASEAACAAALELLDAGRIPPFPPEARGEITIPVCRRLWVGSHRNAAGFWVAVVVDHRLFLARL